ncbi:MAG: hypothetical protein GF419_09360 [Ignavibacteriales bacterium]|nr:hypothetical protein [Ignavibacteriales bacterium]
MKTKVFFLAFVATLGLSATSLNATTVNATTLNATNETHAYRYGGPSFGYFYSELSPYGAWIEMRGGLVVWKPRVYSRSWTPYADGRWLHTSYGWYWDSREPYGHIVYHYGRWHYDDYYGWIWVPDYEWAPAWVEWRYDGGYIGWAPLSPYARVGRAHYGGYTVHYRHWHFVEVHHFHHVNVRHYYVPASRKSYVFSNTKYRTNYYDAGDGRYRNVGVEPDEIYRRSGVRVKTRDMEFERSDNRGGVRISDDRVRVATPDRNDRRDVDYRFRQADRSSSLDDSGDRIRVGVTRNDIDRGRAERPSGRDDANARNDRGNRDDDLRNDRDAKTRDDNRDADLRNNRDAGRDADVRNNNSRNDTRQNTRDDSRNSRDNNRNDGRIDDGRTRDLDRDNHSPSGGRHDVRTTPRREEDRGVDNRTNTRDTNRNDGRVNRNDSRNSRDNQSDLRSRNGSNRQDARSSSRSGRDDKRDDDRRKRR